MHEPIGELLTVLADVQLIKEVLLEWVFDAEAVGLRNNADLLLQLPGWKAQLHEVLVVLGKLLATGVGLYQLLFRALFLA